MTCSRWFALIVLLTAAPFAHALGSADFDNDGAVTSSDVGFFMRQLESARSGGGWDSRCDLNADTVLNRADASLVLEAYLGTGGTSIGPSGGTVDNGSVQVVFPSGAVTQTITVTVHTAASPPADARVVPGTAFDFTPNGAVFSKTVTMTIHYDPAQLPAGRNESSLRLCRASGGVWQPVPGGTVNTTAKTASAGIGGFSTYAILAMASGPVYAGNYTIKTPADAAGLASYSGVTGNLVITWPDDTLVDLTGLSSITWVGGDLTIEYAYKLTDISALASLAAVDGNLYVWNSPLLASLSGFSGLVSVGGSIDFDSDPLVADLSPLANLKCVGGTLEFRALAGLTHVDQLAGLQYLGSLDLDSNSALTKVNLPTLSSQTTLTTLYADANPVLTEITGLEGVTTMTGSLTVTKNASLAGLSFPQLKTVSGGVSIGTNNAIVTFNGLPKLETIAGGLNLGGTFSGTDHMTSFALPALKSVGGGLQVYRSSTLASLSLPDLTTVAGNLTVSHCAALTSLTGLSALTRARALIVEYTNTLASLDGLQACAGYDGAGRFVGVTISNNLALTSVAELALVNRTDSDVTIDSNAVLVHLSLPSLHEVDGLLWIKSNGSLRFLDFPTLGTLSRLQIENCPVLPDLQGLNNVAFINGNCAILECPSLTTLNGLGGGTLSQIGGSFTVTHCINLTDLSALSLLTWVAQLHFETCDALKDLTPLSHLTTLLYGVHFLRNASLEKLDGLEGIQFLGASGGSVEIDGNPDLIDVMALSHLLADPASGYKVTGACYIRNNCGLTPGKGLTNEKAQALVNAWGGASAVHGTIDISNNLSAA